MTCHASLWHRSVRCKTRRFSCLVSASISSPWALRCQQLTQRKSASSLNCLQKTRKTLQIEPFSHIVDFALKAAGEKLGKREMGGHQVNEAEGVRLARTGNLTYLACEFEE